MAGTGRHCPDQALGAGADQVFSMGLEQRFPDKIIILGVAILDQRPLHSLLVGVGGNVYLVHGARIKTGIIHDCG